MTDAADIAAFIRARLDEEDDLAEAALTAGLGVDIGPDGKALAGNSDVHDHFATWNPARVLRQNDTMRTIVDDYATAVRLRDEAADRIRAAGDQPDAADLETWSRAQTEAAILAGPIRYLAAIWQDHDGYKPGWAP